MGDMNNSEPAVQKNEDGEVILDLTEEDDLEELEREVIEEIEREKRIQSNFNL